MRRIPGFSAVLAAVWLVGCEAARPHAGAIARAIAPSVPAPVSARAWERLKDLQGDWVGRSTKGWTESINFSLIAQDSYLVESSFDAHPGERMLTIFHAHADGVMLTHYCVARNQPRLRLTGATSDASRLEFTFLDITGVPSRDRGHMDKLVVEFLEDGRVAYQWTWYQQGRESWMERIELTRAGSASPDARAAPPGEPG